MELDLELDLIEHEPTIQEYARYHGLCSDYTQESLHLDCITGSSVAAINLDLDLHMDSLAPVTNIADTPTKEPLAVSKQAAMLLKSTHPSVFIPSELSPVPNDHRCIRRLKQENPILRTDNELDMLGFGSAMQIDMNNPRIPLEFIGDESDSGLDWPPNSLALPEQWDARVRQEKFGVPRDILLFISETTRYDPAFELPEVFDDLESYRQKRSIDRPLTPPLLPLTPPMVPYIPSSPGNQMPLLSEDSNSITEEASTLQTKIMHADALVRRSDESDFMLMDAMDADMYETLLEDVDQPTAKRKASDIKVEGPLTPSLFSDSPLKKLKTVSFADMLVEFIPAPCWGETNDPDLPSNFEDGNDILTEEDEYAFFKTIEPAAEAIKWESENEKLLGADTVTRIDVPHLDFRLPTAPWDEFTSDFARMTSAPEKETRAYFLQWIKRNYMKLLTSWHGTSELDRRLPLGPFSYASAQVSIEEKLHGEEFAERMLHDTLDSNPVTSSTDMWKRDGLHILEIHEQDDEELEIEVSEQSHDLDSLIRKRKLELEEASDDQNYEQQMKRSRTSMAEFSGHFQHDASRRSQTVTGSAKTCADVIVRAGENRKGDHEHMANEGDLMKFKEQKPSLMFGGKFSATSALNNFMTLQGMKTSSKPVAQGRVAADHSQVPPMPSSIHPENQPQITSAHPSIHSTHQTQNTSQKPRDLPSIPRNMSSCSFIISSTLLQRRSLSKEVETLYPNAEFVSRDFDTSHGMREEADLIISPSTGLIVTTLQRLKQQALPGQPSRSPIKERVLALHDIYERLVVLISEGLRREEEQHDSCRPLDHRDQEALAEYEKFASQMSGEVLVQYVSGGEQALARTIVCTMAEYGLPHGSKDIGDIKLLVDQTTWEIFLRRAGLNAFAAQVILALLKNPVDWPHLSLDMDGAVETCGLQTLLLMTGEQRVQNFQAVMGGSRVLTRVSALLDEQWLSAAHGFRIRRGK